jgi:hypothetical protein
MIRRVPAWRRRYFQSDILPLPLRKRRGSNVPIHSQPTRSLEASACRLARSNWRRICSRNPSDRVPRSRGRRSPSPPDRSLQNSDRHLRVRSLGQRTEYEIASPGWCPMGSHNDCFRIHLWPLHFQSVMGGSGVRLRSRSRRIPSNWNAGRNVLASDCSQITDSESSHQRLTASKVCGPLAGLASPSDGHYRIASCWNGL